MHKLKKTQAQKRKTSSNFKLKENILRVNPENIFEIVIPKIRSAC